MIRIVVEKESNVIYYYLVFSFYYYKLNPNSINVKGKQFPIDSLIMSLLFEQYKIKKIIAIA